VSALPVDRHQAPRRRRRARLLTTATTRGFRWSITRSFRFQTRKPTSTRSARNIFRDWQSRGGPRPCAGPQSSEIVKRSEANRWRVR
jgi:hypothetical protein